MKSSIFKLNVIELFVLSPQRNFRDGQGGVISSRSLGCSFRVQLIQVMSFRTIHTQVGLKGLLYSILRCFAPQSIFLDERRRRVRRYSHSQGGHCDYGFSRANLQKQLFYPSHLLEKSHSHQARLPFCGYWGK